jgi:hypothetical protein
MSVTLTLLKSRNVHPRDEFITFEEGPHIYTVHGKQGYTSVTTWNHHHFPVFDSLKIIENILKNKKHDTDPNYKYYKMTQKEIQDSWDKNRDEAAGAGTKMHYDIECYYNGVFNENNSIEFQYFKKFVSDFPNLKPYRTEWMVYYEELKISGSIDMIFENPDGTLEIYDWKRAKEITFDTNFGKYAITECISHLPDTNFHHYSLQLNMYKMILEHKYGKKVTGLYLVCLHPDNPYKTYDRIEVPFLEKEMTDLLELRKREIISL